VAGYPELRKKILDYTQTSRGIKFSDSNVDFDALLSNGAKHTVYNVLGALVNPGEEVILLAPYWVSYPEMVKFWGGEFKVVGSHSYDGFTPVIEDIEKQITDKTKAIIVNSPQNPTGVNYSEDWMKSFAELLQRHPHVHVISDEIYYELSYYDPKPTYFYQHAPELLERTVIVDGISKSFACTGLRIGWCVAPKDLTAAITKLQGQTTSGASSLIQKALIDFDFNELNNFLVPVKAHLRQNAEVLGEIFRNKDLSKCWYQSSSAFYFMIDYKRTPVFEKYSANDPSGDYAVEISDDLLKDTGVAVVPGSDFGAPNTARLSIVLEEGPFTEAMEKLTDFLCNAN
jgi:aspartate aminotransferase